MKKKILKMFFVFCKGKKEIKVERNVVRGGFKEVGKIEFGFSFIFLIKIIFGWIKDIKNNNS